MRSHATFRRPAARAALGLAAFAALLGCAAVPARAKAGPQAPQAPYRALVERSARKHGVEARLILGLIEIESGFNPKARSTSGARGLMQLMPETGKRFGARDLEDPAQNIDAGTAYLRYLLDLFDGDRDRAIAGYNAGEMAIFRAGGVPESPAVRRFVEAVKTAARRY